MDSNVNIAEYKQLLNKIKQRVILAQKRAIFSASAEIFTKPPVSQLENINTKPSVSQFMFSMN